jgi:uncharacterized protein YunC (DUF1805 family)
LIQQKIQLKTKQGEGYVIPLGPANLVFVLTDKGMVSCGAIDVMVLDKFNYPAARVKSVTGKPIATVADLLDAVVKDANESATKLGVVPGMTGQEAVDKL